MIRLYKTTLSTGYNLSLYFQVHHTAKEGGEKSWDTLVNVSKIIFIVTFQRGHRKKKASYPITATPFRGRQPELQS